MKLTISPKPRAWLRDGKGKIAVHFNLYPEVGDPEYNEFLRDEIIDGVPTGKKILHTIKGVDYNFDADVTEVEILATGREVLPKLVAQFRAVFDKAAQLSHLEGVEIKEEK